MLVYVSQKFTQLGKYTQSSEIRHTAEGLSATHQSPMTTLHYCVLKRNTLPRPNLYPLDDRSHPMICSSSYTNYASRMIDLCCTHLVQRRESFDVQDRLTTMPQRKEVRRGGESRGGQQPSKPTRGQLPVTSCKPTLLSSNQGRIPDNGAQKEQGFTRDLDSLL